LSIQRDLGALGLPSGFPLDQRGRIHQDGLVPVVLIDARAEQALAIEEHGGAHEASAKLPIFAAVLALTTIDPHRPGGLGRHAPPSGEDTRPSISTALPDGH